MVRLRHSEYILLNLLTFPAMDWRELRALVHTHQRMCGVVLSDSKSLRRSLRHLIMMGLIQRVINGKSHYTLTTRGAAKKIALLSKRDTSKKESNVITEQEKPATLKMSRVDAAKKAVETAREIYRSKERQSRISISEVEVSLRLLALQESLLRLEYLKAETSNDLKKDWDSVKTED
jgi:hypothetical protein